MRAVGAHAAEPAAFPAAHYVVGIGAGHPAHFLAARTQQRVQQLDGVNRVPRQVEVVVWLERAGPPDDGARRVGELHGGGDSREAEG